MRYGRRRPGLLAGDVLESWLRNLAVRSLVIPLVVAVLLAFLFVILIAVVRGAYPTMLRFGLARRKRNDFEVILVVCHSGLQSPSIIPRARERKRIRHAQLGPGVASCSHARSRLPASDHADLTISLEDRQPYVADMIHVAIQPQVLQHVVLAQTIALRSRFVERAVPHDDVAAALDQEAQCVGSARPVREHSMKEDQHKATAE